MSRKYKYWWIMVGMFALVAIVGAALVPVSSASPGRTVAMAEHKPMGLTAQGITNAQRSGLPSHLVTMAPQSSLKLLSQATKIGPRDPRSRINLTVSMKLAHPVKLHQFLRQVQNPGSPVYHQWLTPGQATARFGPTQAQIQTVVKWLKSQGIQVLGVTPNRILIHTRATTQVYQHAFNIEINNYKLGGRTFYSTADRPKLPRSIAGLVQNVVGLNRGVRMRPMHEPITPLKEVQSRGGFPQAAPPPATNTVALRPSQVATAYNVPDITDPSNGQGVTIAILTANSPDLASVSTPHVFWQAYGLPDHDISVKVVPQGATVLSGGMGETQLDIQWSGVWASGANLHVYVAANAYLSTFLDMYSEFQTDNIADVMTTSWGLHEQGGTFEQTNEQIFALAAAQGISMFAAAGDDGSGDATDDNNACDYPSASLYITAAGGTELTTDLQGHRTSEVASRDTGGAICKLHQPVWQTGSGVPQNGARNTSDMALNYGNVMPYIILYKVQWGGVSGTSVVSPQLAGMFAVAVSRNGGNRLGQSNELIYNLVNAGHYSTDFHDITSGSNGAYSAGPGWDHPTGWGTPNATKLISHLGVQGPKGTLEGTVTAAASGTSIKGAKVVVTTDSGIHYTTTTLTDGSYSIVLPAGTVQVKVGDFGYTASSASVTISDGETTTHDVTLQTAPKATLSGTVTDGSGHGYGLYTHIKVKTQDFGLVASVWTDPKTGAYSVELPKGFDYSLMALAAYNGYQTGTATLTLNGDTTKNFVLQITQACVAPGYTRDFGEDFNGATFPPAGWTVTNDVQGGFVVWKLNSAWHKDNVTGGTGTAASADSDAAGSGSGSFDTSLVTPPIDVASLHNTMLKYKTNFQVITNGDEAFDLDITTDGGSTWTNIFHWTEDHGAQRGLPGENVSLDLAPYLSSSGTFQLRWRYYDHGYGWDWYAMVDDVSIGTCHAISGGMVLGQVTDSSTGQGIVGATVTADSGALTRTMVNSADPDLPVGFYGFFLPKGQRTLTATALHYSPATADVSIPGDGSVRQNFALKSSRFKTSPDAISLHVTAGNSATASFALTNTGTGEGTFRILPFDAPPPVSAMATGPFAMTPHYAADIDLSALMAPGGNAHPIGNAKPRLPKPSSNPHAAGDLVKVLYAGIPTYGLGVDHNAHDLWLGSPVYGGTNGDNRDHRFLFDGTNTGDTINVAGFSVLYMADMAFNANTGMLWQVGVGTGGETGSQSHIYELDPETMQPTGESILIPSIQSERGLAYDPMSNTWYTGDYSSNSIYHFDASGTLLDSKNVELPTTGLAYNPATGHLFVLTSAGKYAIFVLDTHNN